MISWSYFGHMLIICWSYVDHMMIICWSYVDHMLIIWYVLLIILLRFMFWYFSSFYSLTPRDQAAPWVYLLWSGSKAQVSITKGKRFEHEMIQYQHQLPMSSGWNRLWLSRISHIWEKRPGWLQRGTLRGLPFKRFARKPPKGNSASRPRRLPRIPKAWLGLPGSDNQALLEKIGESRFEERNRRRGRCLNPANQNCGIYLQIYLHSWI